MLADASDALPFAEVRHYNKPIDYLRYRCKSRPQIVLKIFPGSLRNEAKSDESLMASLQLSGFCRKRNLKAHTKAAELLTIEKHEITGRGLSACSSDRKIITEE